MSGKQHRGNHHKRPAHHDLHHHGHDPVEHAGGITLDPNLASQEVQWALENLANAGTADQIRATGAFPALAGVLASDSVERGLDRDNGDDARIYEEETLKYSGFDPHHDIPGVPTRRQDFTGFRRVYCQALLANPVSRAMAYLAVGEEGVKQMERGHAPFHARMPGIEFQYRSLEGKDKDAELWEWYDERHHRARKSGKKLYIHAADGNFRFPKVNEQGEITNLRQGDRLIEMPTNSVGQLVLISGGPSPETDFHAFYHGAFQLAQEGVGIRQVVDGIHATGLFYPPLSRDLLEKGGFRTIADIKNYLQQFGGKPFIKELEQAGFFDDKKTIQLADGQTVYRGSWAEKIVAYCEAVDFKPYVLSEQEVAVMQAYRHVYETHNITDEERPQLASINDGNLNEQALTHQQRRWLQNTRREVSRQQSVAYFQSHFGQGGYTMPSVSRGWQIMPPKRWEQYEQSSHLSRIIRANYQAHVRKAEAHGSHLAEGENGRKSKKNHR